MRNSLPDREKMQYGDLTGTAVSQRVAEEAMSKLQLEVIVDVCRSLLGKMTSSVRLLM